MIQRVALWAVIITAAVIISGPIVQPLKSFGLPINS